MQTQNAIAKIAAELSNRMWESLAQIKTDWGEGNVIPVSERDVKTTVKKALEEGLKEYQHLPAQDKSKAVDLAFNDLKVKLSSPGSEWLKDALVNVDKLKSSIKNDLGLSVLTQTFETFQSGIKSMLGTASDTVLRGIKKKK